MTTNKPAIKVFHNVQVPERSDAIYKVQFTAADAAETVLLPASVSAIAVTLTLEDGTVVNSRSAINALDTNGGSLDAQGWFRFLLEGADHVITQAVDGREMRVLSVAVTYNRTGAVNPGLLKHEVRYYVHDLLHFV